jgi:hypothetical protein
MALEFLDIEKYEEISFLLSMVFFYISEITNLRLPDINPLKTKRRPLYLKTQSVPRCKHFSSRL